MPARSQEDISPEYRSKATALVNFASFIEWPDSAFSSKQARFSICILGDYRLGIALAKLSRTPTPTGRQIDVRWLKKEQESQSCQILFISSSAAKRYAEVFRIVRGTNVLTVGETDNFLDAGGTINLIYEQDSLKFEINLEAARDQHLKVSSQILAIARRVVNKTESARS